MSYFNVYRLLSVLCLFLFTFMAVGNTLHVKRYTIEQGLSQEAIRAIHQDRLGYLWLGTEEGLNRFDGISFTQYRSLSNKEASISSDLVYAITESQDGNLWIGTKGQNGGLNKYIYNSDSFLYFQHNNQVDSLSENNINSLFIDSQQRLWIGTDKGGVNLLISESEGGKFKRIQVKDGLSSNAIRAISEDSFGRIWIGTDDAGVNIINTTTWEISHINKAANSDQGLSDNSIRSLSQDSNGNMYIGTAQGGLNHFIYKQNKFIHYLHNSMKEDSLSSNRVLAIFKDNQSNLWLGTDQGVNLFKKGRFVRYYHEANNINNLSPDRVFTIMQDSGGIMWFGTFAGLDKWNPERANFNHVRYEARNNDELLSYNVVTYFAEDRQGKVFIGTYGAGLLTYDPKDGAFTSTTMANGLSDNRIMAILIDKHGGTWLGTRDAGISYQVKGEVKWQHFGSKDFLPATGVTDILQDKQGHIWVTTYKGGLSLWLPQEKKFRHYFFKDKAGNSINKIYQVHQDKHQNMLWLVTTHGLISFNPETAENTLIQNIETNKESLSSDHILYLYEDNKGDFWLATHGGGLNFWSRENRLAMNNVFTHYTSEDGLVSNSIYGITEDFEGNIWFSSNRGLTRFNQRLKTFKHYNKSQGLQGNDFNHNAVLRSSSGELYFGGSNGFNHFDPLLIKDNKHVPNVELTQISSLNKVLHFPKPLHLLDSVDFYYQDYLVTFEFIGLDFAMPGKNQYKYKLQGFDSDWIDAKNHPRATYTNLPPNEYVFSVKASNNDGVWSEESINLQVKVHAPFWLSWWAYLIYIVLIVGSLYFWLRGQTEKLAKEEQFNQKLSGEVDKHKFALQQVNSELKEAQEKNNEYRLLTEHSKIKTSLFLSNYLPLRLASINQQFDGVSLINLAEINVTKLFAILIKFDDGIINNPEKLINLIDSHSQTSDLIVQSEPNEFIVIIETSNTALVESFVEAIIDDVQQSALMDVEHLNIGFSCYPFDNLYPDRVSWDKVLLIANQALMTVTKSSKHSWLGVLGCRCESSELLINELLTSDDLTKQAELLILAQRQNL